MTPLQPYRDGMLHDFSLTKESVIIEAGTHQGHWAALMSQRYFCHLYGFEPISEFWLIAQERLRFNPKIVISHCGLANFSRTEKWFIKGEMTGSFNKEGKEEEVILIDFIEWLHVMAGRLPAIIDLLAVNIEGGEYELLEAIMVHGKQTRFREILIQFHGVGATPQERQRGIREGLAKTHDLRFTDSTYWECWSLRP